MSYELLSQQELSALLLSGKVALVSSALNLPLAVGVGWFLARKKFVGKTIVDGILNLPLVMPPVTTGYLLLLLLGTNGLIGKFLFQGLGLRIAFTWYAAVIACQVVSFPLFARAVRIAFEMTDPGLEEAARTLGCSPFKAFLTVSLPLALPGICNGLALCTARSLGEFGATITFAGNISGETQTIPLAVYSLLQNPGGENGAMKLVIISILISFTALIASEFSAKRLRRHLNGAKS